MRHRLLQRNSSNGPLAGCEAPARVHRYNPYPYGEFVVGSGTGLSASQRDRLDVGCWEPEPERWFAELTTKKLRRGTHTSVRQLNTTSAPRSRPGTTTLAPYVWIKNADQILESIGNYCQRISDSGH